MIENTVAILVEKEGKILLVKRLNKTFRGWWCLPGGHAEPNETIEQAAQREVREEAEVLGAIPLWSRALVSWEGRR